MQFAVLTGCLRVSKESIFTGFNNFNVYTVQDVRYSQYFGFTDDEVKEMLRYYGLSDKFEVFKEWYDGYHFGNVANAYVRLVNQSNPSRADSFSADGLLQ